MHAVIAQAAWAAEDHHVTGMEGERLRLVAALQAAEREVGVVAEGERDDRPFEVGLVVIAVEAEPAVGGVDVDQARVGFEAAEACILDQRLGDFAHDLGDRRPGFAGLRVRGFVAVAALVGVPAAFAAVRQAVDHVGARRHLRAKQRRLGDHLRDVIEDRFLLGGLHAVAEDRDAFGQEVLKGFEEGHHVPVKFGLRFSRKEATASR